MIREGLPVSATREVLSGELGRQIAVLAGMESEIRAADAALREMRTGASEVRAECRRLQLAVYALDGLTGLTVQDADTDITERLGNGD